MRITKHIPEDENLLPFFSIALSEKNLRQLQDQLDARGTDKSVIAIWKNTGREVIEVTVESDERHYGIPEGTYR